MPVSFLVDWAHEKIAGFCEKISDSGYIVKENPTELLGAIASGELILHRDSEKILSLPRNDTDCIAK